jgi:hypothetical protein
MKESSIRSSILKWLNSLPESHFEVSPPNSPTGKPDITGCLSGIHTSWGYRGRYVAIEVKVPGKKPRLAQRYAMDKLREAGAFCIVATNLEQVQTEIIVEFGLPLGIGTLSR